MNAPRGLPVSNVAPYPTGPSPRAARPLRILFVVSAHNSLSQRALVALTELGHDVDGRGRDSGAEIEAAVNAHDPELVVCPMLKTFIPETVLANAPLPRRAPRPAAATAGRPRSTGRSSSGRRVGRDRARGDRGGRRRRHLGDTQFRSARSARAASTATRSGAPRSRRVVDAVHNIAPANFEPRRSTTTTRA